MANEMFSDFTLATSLDGTETLVGVKNASNGEYPIRFFPITVKVSLSSADILTLSTIPVTLIAAQGAGTYINVLSAAFRMNFGSIAYATNTTLRLEIGSMNPVVTTNTIIASATNDWIVSSPTQSLEVSGTPDWVNILLRAKILTGNPTAGNGTLDIYITYNVITL